MLGLLGDRKNRLQLCDQSGDSIEILENFGLVREQTIERALGDAAAHDDVFHRRAAHPFFEEQIASLAGDRQRLLALPGAYDDIPIDEAMARIFRVDIDDEANHERMLLIRFVIVEAREFPELRTLLHERGGDRSRRDLARWLSKQQGPED